MATILKLISIPLFKQHSHIRVRVLFLSASLFLSGCLTCGSCFVTQEIADEMNLLGMTIGSLTTPEVSFDQAIVRLDSTVLPEQKIALVSLYMAPKDDDLFISEVGLGNSELQANPYRFSFSALENDNFIEIPQSDNVNFSTSDQGSYGGHLRADPIPHPEFDYGNYLLTTGAQLRIPITATHVEQWFQADANSERELVRRVPLASLSGWVRLFQQN